MPLFEFKCKKCGEKFEELVFSIGGDEEIECPKCGSVKVEKQMSAFASTGQNKNAGRESSCAPTGGS